MSVGGGQLSLPDIAALTGVIVVIFGLLVWFANGIIQMVFGTDVKVTVPSSPRAGQSICVFGVLLLAAGALAFAWTTGTVSPPGGVATPSAIASSPATGTTSPSPSGEASPPTAALSKASVRITSPDGA